MPHRSAFSNLGLLSKTQFISDLTSKFGCFAIILIFHFLPTKTQFTTNITSKFRIVSEKIYISGCRLRNSNFRRKRRILKQSLWAFLSSSWLQKIKITKEGPFGDIKKFRKKSLTMPTKKLKPNLLSYLVTMKALKIMVAKSGSLWIVSSALWSTPSKIDWL